MRIYLKQGQTVDLGEVKEVTYDNKYSVKPMKLANTGDEVYGINSYDEEHYKDVLVQFYNDKNEIFECHQSDVIAVLEDRGYHD